LFESLMIRITFLVHSLEVGGAEVQLTVLACGLDRNEFEPTVICFHDQGALLEELRDAGIPVATLGLRGRHDAFGFFLRLIRAVRASRPDVVYSYLDFPNAIAAIIKPLARRSRLIWGIRTSDMKLAGRPLSWRAFFALERLLARSADLIICNSWAGRQHLRQQRFRSDAMTVVANGIDTERFRPNPVSRKRWRAEFDFSDNDIVIGLVARLDPVKDHETFLRAASELAHELPTARFVCIGGGPTEYAEELRRLGDALGLGHRLIWTGPRDDVSDLLNALDIATLCSAYGEGFPNAVGEGMAMALPFVTTDVGDAARVVGDADAVVPIASPFALAAAWRQFAELSPEARAEAGAAARARIVTCFPRKTMIEKTSDLLRGVQLKKTAQAMLSETS
jgi:glycosyltransferase involved in cell wall biosynthesis